MSLTSKLVTLVRYMQKQMIGYPNFLTPEQLEESGVEDAWAAKDNLFHSLYWSNKQLEKIESFESGQGEKENDEDFEVVNKKIFHVYKDRSWEDARSLAEETYREILDYLDGVDDERLLSIREGQEQPIWRDIVGSYITHPMIHLWEQLTAAGKVDKIVEIFGDEYHNMLLELDDSDNYRGGLFYNQACLLALSGELEEAVQVLGKALKKTPALIDWSKKDSDLDALRELPEFKDLYD